jgi:hypothetical protein
MAYGFSTPTLAGMVCDGFVTVAVDTVCTGGRTIKLRTFRITDVGRKVVAANTRTMC